MRVYKITGKSQSGVLNFTFDDFANVAGSSLAHGNGEIRMSPIHVAQISSSLVETSGFELFGITIISDTGMEPGKIIY